MPCSEESDVPADEELRPNVRASDDANVGAGKLRESSIGKVLMKKVITAAVLSARLDFLPYSLRRKRICR